MNKVLQKPGRWLSIVPMIVLVLLISVFGKRLIDVQNGDGPSSIPTVLINKPVPNLNLAPLPGRGVGLTTDRLLDKVSLINFYGSWCIACLAEHSLLMKIKNKNLATLHGIAWRDEPTASLNWLRQNGDPYELIGQDPYSETAIEFGVTGAPETFLIDKNGIIQYKHVGPLTSEIFDKVITPLIKELSK